MSLGSQFLMFKHNVVIQSASNKMFEETVTLETSRTFYPVMQGHNPEEWILQLHHHVSQKTHKSHSFYTFSPDLDKFYANRHNKTSWSFAPVIIMMAIIGQQPRKINDRDSIHMDDSNIILSHKTCTDLLLSFQVNGF